MTSATKSSDIFDTERPSGPDDSLWTAIRSFPLDDPEADLSFTRRLARDHLWTDDFAARVVAEYRRFLYLMATGTETVTPSEAVDEAWHLHLSYTRSYWDELCGRIVGRPLHHDPTRGGEDERDRFRAAYALTLSRYRDTFRAPAPADIWPDADTRFAVAGGYRTVALRDHWIMRRLWSPRVGRGLAMLGGMGAFLGGGMAGWALFPTLGIMGPVGAFVGVYAFGYAASAISGGPGSLILTIQVDGSGSGDSDGGGGCGGCGG